MTTPPLNPQKSADPLADNLQRLDANKQQLDGLMAQVYRTLGANRIALPQELQTSINNALMTLQRELKALSKSSRGISKQLANMQGLVRTSALITSSLELDKVLNDIIDTIIMLTGAERAYLMLRESGTEDLKIRAARNWDQESLTERDVVFSKGVIEESFRQRKPIVTLNAQEDERFQNRQSIAVNQLRSILCIPLILQDEVLGVLYTDNKAQMGLFDEDTVPLMTAFASQAAIAIANARRFQRVQLDLDDARREVQRLRIVIDTQKLEEEVNQITESDYFQLLEKRVDEMRSKFNKT